MTTTPRIRSRKDGSTYSRSGTASPRGGKVVETSKSFDDHGAAQQWARLLDRVGAAEAERILTAQLGAAHDELVTLTQ